MSHHATNWAIKVRGIKPAAKLVLSHLADCHNTHNGCFPSQERLARDCEISRSSLNNQLDLLERVGLIKREKRFDFATKRQESTLYELCFDVTRVQNLDTEAVSKKTQKPCPKIGESRVQNLDTNPVIEPVKEPVRTETALPSDDLDKILYQRGKALLGQKSGGLITKLKGMVGTGQALELIDVASRKENPNEYVAGIIHETGGRNRKIVRTLESAAKIADTILADREETGIRY